MFVRRKLATSARKPSKRLVCGMASSTVRAEWTISSFPRYVREAEVGSYYVISDGATWCLHQYVLRLPLWPWHERSRVLIGVFTPNRIDKHFNERILRCNFKLKTKNCFHELPVHIVVVHRKMCPKWLIKKFKMCPLLNSVNSMDSQNSWWNELCEIHSEMKFTEFF